MQNVPDAELTFGSRSQLPSAVFLPLEKIRKVAKAGQPAT